MNKNKKTTVVATVVTAEVLSEKQEVDNDLFTQDMLWEEAEFNIKHYGGNTYSWVIESEYKRLLEKYVAMHKDSRLERDVFGRCGLALYTPT